MKKILIAFSLVAITVGLMPSAQAANIVTLTVSASGANEPGGGAKVGSATGTFTLNKTKGIICSTIKTKGLTSIIGSHIHTGVKGVTAEIVVTIDALKFNISGENCVKAPAALLKDIAANPSAYYFNIHSTTFPGGAVRGQLSKSK
jgi:hypothetical protein